MKIRELIEHKQGERVTIKAVLAEKCLVPNKNGGNYLSIAICDSDGRLAFPIFEDSEEWFEKLEVLIPYEIKGTVNIWNGTTQLKNVEFRPLNEGEFSSHDFVNSYQIPNSLISFFEDVVENLQEPYREFAKTATGCCGYNDDLFNLFLTCPSAEKHHGNRIGGLFLHTLGVMSNVANVPKLYSKLDMYGDINSVINSDRLMLKAILHDIMKINEYEYKTCIRRKPNVVGHLYDGLIYITEINKKLGNILSYDEMEDIKYSILSHHGEYGPCKPKTLEDMLLHLADMIDSRVVGELEK